jgi:hypothetical protein
MSRRHLTYAVKSVIRDAGYAFQSPIGLYLIGSYARGAADTASDLDVIAIAHGDRDRIGSAIGSLYSGRFPRFPTLDLTVFNLAQLERPPRSDFARIQRREVLFPLADHGIRISGPDFAHDIVARLSHLGAASAIQMPWVFCRRVRGLPEQLSPVDVSEPPDQADDFLGYLYRDSVKPVVTLSSWIGTAIVAIRSGRDTVAAKEQVIAQLQELDPELSYWLDGTVTLCRMVWHYAAPRSPSDRRALRAICLRLHELEQAYAEEFRRFSGEER